jgi:hypothetical protein
VGGLWGLFNHVESALSLLGAFFAGSN